MAACLPAPLGKRHAASQPPLALPPLLNPLSTQVCTSELGAAAKLHGAFQERGVQMVALSCNELESHKQCEWACLVGLAFGSCPEDIWAAGGREDTQRQQRAPPPPPLPPTRPASPTPPRCRGERH